MSPDKEAPRVEAPVDAAPTTPETPNHAERGREIAGAGAERIKGAFGRMREKFNGFVGRAKERAGSLAEKGANLLFSGIGAGEYYAKMSAEKVAGVVEKTTAKAQEVMAAVHTKKAEFSAKRDATIESWNTSKALRRMGAEMRKLDRNLPYESVGAVNASEQRSAEQIQSEMETKMESMRSYHENLRQQIAAKEALQARIDEIRARKSAGSGSSTTEQAAA